MALVGGIVSAIAAAFLGVAGWFSPSALTPGRMIDTFERINGHHPGFRRNHAKGLGASGFFESNGQGVALSTAVVFRPARVPIIGRFALAGGLPEITDTPGVVRSLALEFQLPDGEQWRTGMNAIPVFPVRTPAAFYDQLVAMAPVPGTGKPDPAKASAFMLQYPDSASAIRLIKAQKPAAGFTSSTYNSLNAFVLVDAQGHRTAARWSMVPEDRDDGETAGATPSPGKNSLFDDLATRIHRSPARWHLVFTLAEPGDPSSDATQAWPPERRKVDVGTLIIDHVESEATSPARTINFDPLILPSGIEPSDDPLLSARSAAYSVSFRRRVSESVSPSAVTPREVEGVAIR